MSNLEKYKKPTFKLNKPLKPFQQLLCVLPPTSAQLVPFTFQQFFDKGSILKGYYPESFTIDYSGKRREWEGIPQLPMIDFQKINNQYEVYAPHLSHYDQRRNKINSSYVYQYDPKSTFDLKSPFGTIECHCVSKRISI